MRSLEIIRRVNLLSEVIVANLDVAEFHYGSFHMQDNYPSIFGYMEDLYHAHEQLWTCTFEPCLHKVRLSLKYGLYYNRAALLWPLRPTYIASTLA